MSSGLSAFSESRFPLCNDHTNRNFPTNGKHPLLRNTSLQTSFLMLNIDAILNKCEARSGKILVEFFFFSPSFFFFFASLWSEPQASSLNMQIRTRPNIFLVRTGQASSIQVLLLWLYFKCSTSIAHLYRRNAHALLR